MSNTFIPAAWALHFLLADTIILVATIIAVASWNIRLLRLLVQRNKQIDTLIGEVRAAYAARDHARNILNGMIADPDKKCNWSTLGSL